jgi:hypothetical protein
MTAFSTSCAKVEIEIDGKPAEVREMTGQQMSEYMAEMAGRMTVDAAGKPVGVTDYRGIQSLLVCLCLHLDGSPVTKDVVEGWSSSTVKGLFTLCQQVNGMTEAEAEAVKNG